MINESKVKTGEPAKTKNLVVKTEPRSQATIDKLLASCGGGRTLVVAFDPAWWMEALLRRGVDAYALSLGDDASAGDHAAPGRLVAGSMGQLPYADNWFDTVVALSVLQSVPEDALSQAIGDLRRVARRFVFATLPAREEVEEAQNVYLRGRPWWEEAFFKAGFRKHPSLQQVLSYEMLENENDSLVLLFEKMPPAAAEKYPIAALAAERDLHMDMLRESGRRADAHVARYQLAASYVRPNDVVLDVACGLGYGAAVLARNSEASRVIGVDNSEYAIGYATACYGEPGVEFRLGDALDLSFLPDQSVDLVASFETLEHLAEPEMFLTELHRVLRPAGRILVSVPNDWTDESGKDPNPHHLQVYDWAKLKSQVGAKYIVEAGYAQTAGGGMKLNREPRRIRKVDLDRTGDTRAEWCLIVGMKSPLDAQPGSYVEVHFPTYDDLNDCNITAFGRDYDNPWIVRGMVSIGMRLTDREALGRLAREVLRKSRDGSADSGAAICVLAYQALEQREFDSGKAEALLERIAHYEKVADDKPHAWRWVISNQYVAGRLLLALGKRTEAREAFLRCGEMNCLKFSPLLGTKTVDAFFQAGLIAACDGDPDAARESWKRGLLEARNVLQRDWTNIWGRPEDPASFGLPEATQIADLATRCSFAIRALGHWNRGPGAAWESTHVNLGRELASWKSIANERHEWIKELENGRAWLEKQRRDWKTAAEDQKNWTKELEKTIAWLRQEVENWKSCAEDRSQSSAKDHSMLREELQSWQRIAKERAQWIEELEQVKTWLDTQRQEWAKVAEERGQHLTRLEEQLRKQRASTEDLARELHDQRNRAASLENNFKQVSTDKRNWEQIALEREQWIKELEAGNLRLEEIRAEWEKSAHSANAKLQGKSNELEGLKRELERLNAMLRRYERYPWIPVPLKNLLSKLRR